MQTYVSGIRNWTSRLVRLDGTERIILGRRALLSQKVEQAGLAYVGQAHASHFEILAHAAECHDIVLHVLGRFLGRHFGDGSRVVG